jgi:hypothetical protein
MATQTKNCATCGRDLPLDSFYRVEERAYGPCIDCRRKAGIERYAERKQRARQNFERLAGQP